MGLKRLVLVVIASCVGGSPLPCLAEVVINEIHYHPASEDIREEFIELHNTGAVAVDLGGHSFTNGNACTFAPATRIPPGGPGHRGGAGPP